MMECSWLLKMFDITRIILSDNEGLKQDQQALCIPRTNVLFFFVSQVNLQGYKTPPLPFATGLQLEAGLFKAGESSFKLKVIAIQKLYSKGVCCSNTRMSWT